mmetsp:Transcript_21592/g.43566  ORF Transcript_21592/g.43566 Transcript_21592/m.43566 type:complete len:253 (-) Transcript_21592:355-1113(-)|eukprot:CAMPEP_0170399808 /NCGR_PEP_ID=MMETSP0117_2-20130122/24159_1 /TAXON_ID=400756 /ORGANISM="Durinskia baltica, Strain CSIRO CS-38" /LENGTH=252 /DNA_ID=CAMNT_0010656509 /DNA_START=81 /DNA_END=839 /DNA_ORIENTATION=+
MPTSGTDFCVNVRIMNKESIVEERVRERLGDHPVSRAAGKIANDFVSVEDVAKKIGERMAAGMPKELRGQGIGVSCRLRFQRGPLLVLSVKVVSADLGRLAAAGPRPDLASQLVRCFEFLPMSLHRRLYATALRRLTEALIAEVADKATGDLNASGICAEVTALSLAEETEFLLGAIEDIDSEAKAKSRPSLRRPASDAAGQRSCKAVDVPGKCAMQPCRKPLPRGPVASTWPAVVHFVDGGFGGTGRREAR